MWGRIPPGDIKPERAHTAERRRDNVLPHDAAPRDGCERAPAGTTSAGIHPASDAAAVMPAPMCAARVACAIVTTNTHDAAPVGMATTSAARGVCASTGCPIAAQPCG